MNGAFGDEDGFSALRLCLVKRMKHGVGHEGILIAMDKEHRFGALANLFYLLRLGKRPAVAMLAKGGSGIHQREGRQAKLVFVLYPSPDGLHCNLTVIWNSDIRLSYIYRIDNRRCRRLLLRCV